MIIDPRCTVARRNPLHQCHRRDGRLLLTQREECFSQQRLDLMDPERVGGELDDLLQKIDDGFYEHEPCWRERARERAADAAVMILDSEWRF